MRGCVVIEKVDLKDYLVSLSRKGIDTVPLSEFLDTITLLKEEPLDTSQPSKRTVAFVPQSEFDLSKKVVSE